MLNSIRTKAQQLQSYYEHNESRVDLAFFVLGFLFDVITLSDIDDPWSVATQILYLVIAGSLLGLKIKNELHPITPQGRIKAWVWKYRTPILHFILGSLMSMYSLFFLKSASFGSSSLFLGGLFGLLALNETKLIQGSQTDIKMAIFVLCLFSFFSMMIPVILGHVGWLPFILAIVLTTVSLWGAQRLLSKAVQDKVLLKKRLFRPASMVIGAFAVCYFLGWIPPVPLSVQSMGVYHKIEKVNDSYVASHENPWWRFWKHADETFVALPGDQITFFARIFSPGGFRDTIIVHFLFRTAKKGFVSADKIPFTITGGRKSGFRGYTTKQNFEPGHWQIRVETTDGREIGRTYFEVVQGQGDPKSREFRTHTF